MVRGYDAAEIPSVYDLRDAPVTNEAPGFKQVIFRGIDQMIGMTTIGPGPAWP